MFSYIPNIQYYDFGFDKFHKDYDKIFRLENSMNTSKSAVISRPLAERFFESSPHIVAGAISYPWGGDVFFHVENDLQNFFNEKIILVSPGFTDVFTFDFVEGAENTLKTPGNIIIPLSISRKIFGNESAIGKQLEIEKNNLTVGAVYRDFPDNSVVNNYIYAPIPENENKQNWGNWNYHVYVRVNQASNASLLLDNFKRNFEAGVVFGEGFEWEEEGVGVDLHLSALKDIHFITDGCTI